MQRYLYSASTGGFYPIQLRDVYESSPGGLPVDVVEISHTEHEKLMEGQAAGKVISPDENGQPILTEQFIDWQACAESARSALLTEANSITSDWRIELMLGSITQEDKIKLIAWLNYIKQLKAVDLNLVTDESSLNSIKWPVKPS
ncbi:tail fiber assembly protein [Cronobacter turicensis]|uniref:tail fiber assembly protein n=1 Tax=Cronobacter turicensis TaxID=413502 RepID=UPI0024C38C30|nr:tail fiber assembly protein [Cronobacter turicensis]ELY3758401.1 tail fiber assembly protein [Cronobacter universalis]ELY5850942.1 tail fiber assembly protein [Cronobacter turicensis]MDK1227329.1 tail fiber assembly protein [Cronobacter turicensis]MDK1335871.1 tail fiber assembly protein [Cronobacter turicensis]